MVVLSPLVFQPAATLVITFGGDVFLAREGQPLFSNNPWGQFAQPEAIAPGSPETHWLLINLESPLGEAPPAPGSGYNLCAPQEQVWALSAGGVHLASTLNNHAEDCAAGGQTANVLEQAGLVTLSNGYQPLYQQSPAGIVAFIGANAVGEPLDSSRLLAACSAAAARSDIVIVSLHWGVEYSAQPSQAQRNLAQALADVGVDVLWGHHPHVLQPMEWVTSSSGDHQMLAMYSLGNLLSDQAAVWSTSHSALVSLRFDQDGLQGLSLQPVSARPGDFALVKPSQGDADRISRRLNWEEVTARRP